MADSILYRIFHSFFIQFLVVLLITVNKSSSHTSTRTQTEAFRYIERDFALCRQCGADVADSDDIVNQPSPQALISSNQTLFARPGTEVQLLLNPLDVQFHIFTTSTAKCIAIDENWHERYSWFPGYAWKFCFCSQCGTHVGWMFEPLRTATEDRSSPSNEGFYGLIIHSVISETFANSLLIVPKSYK